jgi:tripartite-type tricarboxylate transporter receptor subunit TctC
MEATMMLRIGLALVSLLVLSAASAQAADWPTKPVRLIVPFAPGGLADIAGRAYADALGTAFGKPFVIENRPGGGGLAAAEAIMRGEPDGYTLMVSGVPTLVLLPAMSKTPTYDPMRDFSHIAYLGGIPIIAVVNPSFGAKTYAEFVAQVRVTTGGVDYVSAGFGTMANWVGEYIAAKENIKLNHVAYRGGSAALVDVLAGHVKVGMLSWGSIAQHVQAGTIIAIAVSSAERLPYAPDLPTLRELWKSDFTASTWFSLSGPPGMPPEIVALINREVAKAAATPEVRKQLEDATIVPQVMTTAEFKAFIGRESERWTPLIKRIMETKQ